MDKIRVSAILLILYGRKPIRHTTDKVLQWCGL